MSVLLHAGLLGSLKGDLPNWISPSEPEPFTAQLRPVVIAQPASPASPDVSAVPRLKALPKMALPFFSPQALVAEPVAPVTDTPLASTDTRNASPDEPPVPPLSETQSVPAAETVPAPYLNALPPHLELRYQVQYGLVSGAQTMVWTRTDDRYTVTSVAEASGLAGMFYRGQAVQTSSGRITASGLQPDVFWDQRGDKRSSARFDAGQRQITYVPAKGAPRHFSYQGEVQDVVSLFFQFALIAPPNEGELSLNLFNGKKLRHYTYGVRGEAVLNTALGEERTLHLVRENDQEGRFEIWLAIDRHYLPVRVLKRDENGNEVELRLVSMTD